MTPTPQDSHAGAVAVPAADADVRRPLPEQAMWDIFLFEPGLLCEGGIDCWRCRHPDDGAARADERWTLTPFPETRQEMFPDVPAEDVAAAVAGAALADLGSPRG